MPDWKNPSDYEFAKDLDRSGWAWEFMRRNKSYRDDYFAAEKSKSKSHLRVGADAIAIGEPPAIALARKWRMTPPIRDPNGNETPNFDLRYPIAPSYEAILDYYNDEESSQSDTSEYAVLVFDLTVPVDVQLQRAKLRLAKLQKGRKLKNPHKFQKHQWISYLRLLDAEMAGASPAQLRKHIKIYKPLSDDADHKHKAADTLWDHRKAAEWLRDNPRSILFLST